MWGLTVVLLLFVQALSLYAQGGPIIVKTCGTSVTEEECIKDCGCGWCVPEKRCRDSYKEDKCDGDFTTHYYDDDCKNYRQSNAVMAYFLVAAVSICMIVLVAGCLFCTGGIVAGKWAECRESWRTYHVLDDDGDDKL